MRTTVNPGSWLELAARLEIVPPSPAGFRGATRAIVIDRETGAAVSLVGLLELFREDPTNAIIGPVRLTIEAEPIAAAREAREAERFT